MNNIHNILITKNDVENIVNKYLDIPIKINNIQVYQNAFMHKSFSIVDPDNSDSDNYSVINNTNNKKENNEVLELLGDKVIDFITIEYLIDNYKGKNEGFLTKLKSKLVNKHSLSNLANKLNFKKFILISSHIERISGRSNERLSEDLFEAFMASLYLDQNRNLEICKQFLLGIYFEFVNFDELINVNTNFKDSLLRLFQANGWKFPVYTTISLKEVKYFSTIVLISKDFDNIPENILKKQNTIIKTINNESNDISKIDLNKNIILGIGQANTKKSSEQECSKDCLINLNIGLNY